MQIQVHKSVSSDMAMLVDWRHFESYWLRSKFAPLDREKLIHAYSAQWINQQNNPWKFTLGEIYFRLDKEGKWEIQFVNGRNRTNLLIKFQNLIPVCISGEIPDDAAIRAGLIRVLNEGDIVNIPYLPIYPPGALRNDFVLGGSE
jgi:hypothetical protein